VDDGWLLAERKRLKDWELRHWGILSEDLDLGFQFRDFLCSDSFEREWWMWREERRLIWWIWQFAFDLLNPIGGRHMVTTLHFYFLRLNSFNRWWNRDFTRFHPILMILPDFNLILPISEFYKRFST
jgi:hypothetical protein